MSKPLVLELLTPAGPLARDLEVPGVEVPGLLGEIGILPEHEPFAGPVAPGVVRFVDRDTPRRIAVGAGFYEVTEEGRVRVLVDRAVDATDVDAAAVRAKIEALASDDSEGAERERAFLEAQLRAAGAA